MLRAESSLCCGCRRCVSPGRVRPGGGLHQLLFHRHTAELPPAFRPAARDVLSALLRPTPTAHRSCSPTRWVTRCSASCQPWPSTARLPYWATPASMTWTPAGRIASPHPELGEIQVWPIGNDRRVDLRRPAYYRALIRSCRRRSQLVVVADTFSLPGALPLLMGIPFLLLHTPTPPTGVPRSSRAIPWATSSRIWAICPGCWTRCILARRYLAPGFFGQLAQSPLNTRG